jgi:branched-chain amino acid transport system substrate-binding protein
LIAANALRCGLLAFALLAASLVPSGAARAADPVDIDAIVSLTGTAAFLGQEEQQALQVVERLENARGGIRGRPVHFIVHDDQSNPQVAVQFLQGVIAKKSPVVLGASLVSTCNAISALIKASGPVQFCFSPGIHPDFDSYTFSSCVNTVDLNGMMLRYFYKLGYRRFALIAATDATGQDSVSTYGAAIAQPAMRGAQMVAVERFNATDFSVVAQLARIKAANPEVLFASPTGTPFATVLHGIRDVGLNVPIGGGIGNIIYSQIKQYESFLPNELYFSGLQFFRDPANIGRPLKDAIVEFDRAFAPTRPDLGQGLAYDPARIIVAALRIVGPDASPTALRDALHAIHGYLGADGLYDFRSGDNRGLTAVNGTVLRYDPRRALFVAVSKAGGEPLHAATR